MAVDVSLVIDDYVRALRALNSKQSPRFTKYDDWYLVSVSTRYPRVDPRSLVNGLGLDYLDPFRDLTLLKAYRLKITKDNLLNVWEKYARWKAKMWGELKGVKWV